jgi:hypothetical protein
MDSSPNNFDSLQKLLKLKRYEQPPPRFFYEFSSHVIARIQASQLQVPRWWHRFGFDLRPAVSVGIGAFACVLLFLGITAEPNNPVTGGDQTVTHQDVFTSVHAEPVMAVNSTNPVINAAGTMMINPFRPRIVPASYQR